MNTVEIGDKFESKSLDILKRLLEEKQLGLLTENIKIFQKKGYYSTLRKKNIQFDLTIEVWPPGAKRYTLLYIIECKDYKTRVPVNKIEDFHSKILQVAGVNAKGIFISNSPIQEGGLNFAESTGMMVIQGDSSEDFKIILHRKSRQPDSQIIPYLTITLDQNSIDSQLADIEKVVDNLIISSLEKILSNNEANFGIDKLSKKDIEIIANNELEKINPKILTDAYTLSTKKLKEYLINEFQIDFWTIEKSLPLGSCDFRKNSIGLNSSLNNSNRMLFILAHEFGHFTLHQNLCLSQKLYDSFEDSEYNFMTGKNDIKNPRQWIEWQANYFAVSLILPKAQVLAHLWKCQDNLGIKRGELFIDDQFQNINDFNKIIIRLSYLFNVSKTSILYRLNEMNLIINRSRLKSVSQIILDYKENYFM